MNKNSKNEKATPSLSPILYLVDNYTSLNCLKLTHISPKGPKTIPHVIPQKRSNPSPISYN